MPYVNPNLPGSAIFLYGSGHDAIEGANWGGSGVIVGIPSQANPSRAHLYAVTNDHIIHQCPVVRLVKEDGQPSVLPGTAADWQSHPDGDDIAIRSLGALPGDELWYIQDELHLTEADLSPQAIGPGDDCLMVGRYINHDLRQFDRPVLRFGNLAMLPEIIRQEKRGFDQESFLVDMRSHAGFSGSPVYVYYETLLARDLLPDKAQDMDYDAFRDATWSTGIGQLWLLGIDWGHLPIRGDVLDDQKRRIGRMEVNGGMTGVVPAWKLTDLLNEPAVKMAREQAERELAEVGEGAAVLDVSTGSEFSRFEDLTSKLVQVPKREIDEKRNAEWATNVSPLLKERG
jgi:hypothetical protein